MKKQTKKRITVAAGIAIAIVIVGFSRFTWKLSLYITEIDRQKSLERTGEFPPEAQTQKVRFQASDGIPLVGIWVPTPDEKAAVILCHGRGSGKGQFLDMGQIRFLFENGYSSFAFDFRATGESGGKHCTLGALEKLDLTAAISEVRKLTKSPIILWGISMGAATAILVGAEDPDIALIIAESSYESFDGTVEHHHRLNFRLPRWPMTPLACWITEWRTGCDIQDADMTKAAANLGDTPLLQVHCEKDIRTTEEIEKRIFEEVKGPKEFLTIPHAEHGKAFEAGGQAYRAKILSYLSSLKS
ncbi:MAG: alpha/beta fold hydrolase [Planctomycetota bacterium]|nr:alpha/beta fold hydrolase [Planctomycetota bacterium]